MREAIIIGSGFGGSVMACRLSRKWKGKVLLLERGRRYGRGEFPRSPSAMADNFWKKKGAHGQGLLEVINQNHMNSLVSAGWGGGSLIYANVFLEPPADVFDERWPAHLNLKSLKPYYKTAAGVLGSRVMPEKILPKKHLLVSAASEKIGRTSREARLNIFFPDEKKGISPGVSVGNRYGASQSACTSCGECWWGCNTHSKNTLDLNYLHVAEHRHGLQAKTRCLAEKIVPLNERGGENVEADGSHGYRVYYTDLASGKTETEDARRVVVSAGTFGSAELMLRCRDHYRSLPRISKAAGTRFSGNGDFLGVIFGCDKNVEPEAGPTITQYTDFGLYSGKKEFPFILEAGGFPSFLAWFAEGVKPRIFWFKALISVIVRSLGRLFTGRWFGNAGFVLRGLLRSAFTGRTMVFLCMGRDAADGTMKVDSRGRLKVIWPWKNSRRLYKGIGAALDEFTEALGGSFWSTVPDWWWPFRQAWTVHPIGGLPLADSPEKGAVSSADKDFCSVFHYRNLYVVDGSVLPGAVGANPSATIAALAEKAAHHLTGIRGDENLR